MSLNILHLPRRKDRMENLKKQLAIQQITDYTIIEGIDAKERQASIPYNETFPVRKAICQSHKMIIGLAKQQQMKNCIIAEDDICFTAPGAWNYFLSQIPEDYDLFCGLIYAGEVKDGRILNGMSGTHTLYSVHERFYDTILSLPDDSHVDRSLGAMACKHKYYVCDPMVVFQLGGYSDNLRREMHYEVYLEGKNLFGL